MGDDFTVQGVLVDSFVTEEGKVPLTLHFGHHDFRYIWDSVAKRDVKTNQHTFYGGMGEGSEFDNWQDAVLASLYDAFQVYDELKDGDEFIATYNDETRRFRCVEKIHVVEVQ